MTEQAAPYAGRHPKDPDPSDPGFCKCGLGLEAWVHTDTTRYREVPLTKEVWDDLRNPASPHTEGVNP